MRKLVKGLVMVLVVAAIAAACSAAVLPGQSSYDPIENGRRIYYTGTNWRGERITYQGGPAFENFGMMQGSLTCASCHGPTAQGGRHFMHMTVMDAPDIRYKALASEEHEEGGGGEHDEQGGEAGYTLEDFRRAVVEGRHPNGDPVDPNMPRWNLSDQDLADLFAFLKTLP